MDEMWNLIHRITRLRSRARVSPSREDDQPMNRELRESVSEVGFGVARRVALCLWRCGVRDWSRTTEVGNLERFQVAAGFEAPAAWFRPLESGRKTE